MAYHIADWSLMTWTIILFPCVDAVFLMTTPRKRTVRRLQYLKDGVNDRKEN